MASTAPTSSTNVTSPSRKVEHHYVDHANDVEMTDNSNVTQGENIDDNSDSSGYSSSSKKMTASETTTTKSEVASSSMINHVKMPSMSSSSDRNFPVKLHFMLNELQLDGCDHIVSWQPHGRCFVVHKQSLFVKSILPMWFRQSKFASFQRQLNLYGFKRLTSGRDKGGYYHELFLRGKSFLAHKIPRTKLKNDGARKSTSPETEPNFYALPFLPEEERKNGTTPSNQHPSQRPLVVSNGGTVKNISGTSSSAAINCNNNKATGSETGGTIGISPNQLGLLPMASLSTNTGLSDLLISNQRPTPDPVTSYINSLLNRSGGTSSTAISNTQMNSNTGNTTIGNNMLSLALLEQSISNNMLQQQQQQQQQQMNSRVSSDTLRRSLDMYSGLLLQLQQQPSAVLSNAASATTTASTTTSTIANASAGASDAGILAQLVGQEIINNQRNSQPTYGSNSNNNMNIINPISTITAAIAAAGASAASSAALLSVPQSPLQQLLQQIEQKQLQDRQQTLMQQMQQQLLPVPNSVLSSSSSILEAARLALLKEQRNNQMNTTTSSINNIANANTNTNQPSLNLNDILTLRMALSNGSTSIDQLLRDAAIGRQSNLRSVDTTSTASGSMNMSTSTDDANRSKNGSNVRSSPTN